MPARDGCGPGCARPTSRSGCPSAIGIACTGPWLAEKTPTQTLGMLMGGWDNVAHFSMVHMIRRFGAVVSALPPPTPGATWQFASYPQGFHASPRVWSSC